MNKAYLGIDERLGWRELGLDSQLAWARRVPDSGLWVAVLSPDCRLTGELTGGSSASWSDG